MSKVILLLVLSLMIALPACADVKVEKKLNIKVA